MIAGGGSPFLAQKAGNSPHNGSKLPKVTVYCQMQFVWPKRKLDFDSRSPRSAKNYNQANEALMRYKRDLREHGLVRTDSPRQRSYRRVERVSVQSAYD
jgi:hypothetical protein